MIGVCSIARALHLMVLVATLFASVPAWAQDRGAVTWTKLPGTAVDLSINAVGQAYALALDGAPWRWDKVEQRWRRMSGKFVRITAAEGNRPWAIDADGVVMRYNGLWWEDKDKGVADVAADATGNVYTAKRDGSIKKWNPLRSEWQPIDGNARRIALDSGGHPWVVTASGTIRGFDGKAWTTFSGQALDIAVGGTDAVVIADTDGAVRTLNIAENRWNLVAGVADVVAVAVTPDGGPWAVLRDGSIMATTLLAAEEVKVKEDRAQEVTAPSITAPVSVAPVSVAPVETAPSVTAPPVVAPPSTATTAPTPSRSSASIDPAAVTTKNNITFVNTRKSVASIAIGKDGSVFGLDAGGKVLRWSNARKTFASFPGTLVRIAVDPEGNPWGVSALGRVFRHTGQLWKQIVGATGSDISIGADGTVLITDASGALYRLNEEQTRFQKITGSGILVAADPDGNPWTVRADKLVQRCDTSPCTVLAQKAVSIAVGPDGSVWVVSDRNLLMRLKADRKSFEVVQTAGHTPSKVAVGPNGYPWVVSGTQLALASNYFERDEGSDRTTAAATAGNTVGTGATETVVTAEVSGFTFTKTMQFETINSDILSPGAWAKLSIGNDGYIYAYNMGGGMGRYDPNQKKFVSKSTFAGDNSYDITDFDVASNGDIWMYELNPNTGLFRERSRVVKEYKVTGGSVRAVAVAPDDTLYAVFSFTGSLYIIYKKLPNSEVLTKFSNDTDVLDIAVGPGSDVWIVDNSNYVQQWTGTKFEKRPASGQKASRIDVGADGTVYVRDTNSALRKWNGANNSFDAINNTNIGYVAVDDDGRPWVSVNNTPTIKRAKD